MESSVTRSSEATAQGFAPASGELLPIPQMSGGHPLLVQACQDAVKEWKFASAPEETTQIVEFEFRAAD